MRPKDALLLSHVRKNARTQLTKLSRQTSIPVSTISEHLKRYEKTYIKRYTTLVNFRKLGYDVHVNLLVRVSKTNRDGLKAYLINHPNVNTLFRISNGFDFLVECVFKNLKDMSEFLEQLDQFNVLEKKEFYLLEDLKRETFMSNPEVAKLMI